MNKVVWIAAVLVALVVSPLALGAQEESLDSAAATVTNNGALTLRAQDSAAESTKRLQVNIGGSDGRDPVTGVADIVGFPLIDSGPWGDVDWKVSGSAVTGVVRTRSGEVEGTFEGTMTPTGVSGKFTHRDGRVGLWSWGGPLPAK
jgi:hypothetical protein